MRHLTSISSIALVLLACFALVGCGASEGPPPRTGAVLAPAADSQKLAASAPRELELPADILPLDEERKDEGRETPSDSHSIAIQYEQAGDNRAGLQGRIVELAATPRASLGSAIREPAAAPLESPSFDLGNTEIAASPPARRSQFVPLDPPSTTQVPLDGPPVLAEKPSFNNGAEPSLELPALQAPQVAAPEAPPSSTVMPQPEPVSPAPEASQTASQSEPPVIAAPPAPAIETHPEPSTSPAPPSPPRERSSWQPGTSVNMQPATVAASLRSPRQVAERAAQISDRGFAMAERGMPYAGSAELIKSLQLVAQALDMQEGSALHATSLASGLKALDEAGDFVSSTGSPAVVNVGEIVAMHQTPVLKSHPAAATLSPVAAQQQYFAYAQAQLAAAGGGQQVASQALYRLGKLQTALAAHDADPQALHAPQAIVFHQAALTTDAANYLAANELGVLLARYGQLPEARSVLLHSVSVRPQIESWHNLAAVHKRLGEEDLSRRAENERDLLAKQLGRAAPQPASDLVRWVDRQTFAKSGNDMAWPAQMTSAPAAKPANMRR